MRPPSGEPACRFVNPAVEIRVATLDVDSGRVHRLWQSLAKDERERAGRFAFERDRRRYIVARGRLRELLAARLGISAESVQFVYGQHGKPALAPGFAETGWRFNVSHADDLAVFALSRGLEVGIDVEAVRELRDAERIAARFFSRHECAAYRALEADEKPSGFFNCWTRKEAFIKALGDGLYYPLDGFDVTLAWHEEARILRMGDTPGERCGWQLYSFVPAPGYVGALVAQAPERREICARAVSSAPALP